MSKVKCNEGQFYAVPLRTKGFGLILVARKSKGAKVCLGYLFKSRFDCPPVFDEVKELSTKDSFTAVRFSSLSIVNGEWPQVGEFLNWNRNDWPFPPFVRRIDFLKTAIKVTYKDDDPMEVVSEDKVDFSANEYALDGMNGAGVIEIILTKFLDKGYESHIQ